MHRIAAAMLIVATVLVAHGSMLREALAAEAAAPPRLAAEIAQPAVTRNAKVLSLLMILESLRQAPVSLDAQKV
ncbi:MAG: hypothetical protein BGO82_07415 [Devosia sp. 67-54]|uniref:hypothetical protein n=1 Tax=unclassified Devosia TaxID=196773 RepID=UPI00095B678F|nr:MULTISPECIES: hypothetical protein [unclassified Devosia]OJX19546.1 MAG: hypothetical protein BGO82_07415 [Devosia sp. 67-54]